MTAPLAAVPPAVVATLASLGWEIRAVEIDLAAGRAVLEVHRADGRWLYLSADALGRATVERWQRRREWQRGAPRAPCYEGSVDTLLGRERCSGARSALRTVAHYLAANPAPGRAELAPETTRAALRLLL